MYFSLNRTKVELKLSFFDALARILNALNRTKVELKLVYKLSSCFALKALNRTKVELKYAFGELGKILIDSKSYQSGIEIQTKD